MEDNNIKEKQVQSTGHVSKHEIIITDKKSRKGPKILLIILGVLMLAGIAVGILLWNEISEYNRNAAGTDYYIIIAEKLNFVQKKIRGQQR